MLLTKPHKTIILKRLAFIIVCFALGWYAKSKLTPSMGMAGFGAGTPYVLVEELQPQEVTQEKSHIAHVEAINSVSLQPEVSGTVEDILFKEGSFVKSGDVLFKIDPEIYKATLDLRQAELDKAEAGLTEAERNYNRQIKLSTKNIASQATFDNAESAFLQAKASVAQAKANLDLAKINYDYTSLKAPIDGYIGKALVTKGNRVVASQQVLAKIVQMDPVRVTFTLNDKELITYKNNAAQNKNKKLKALITLPDGTKILKEFLSVFVDNEVSTNTATVSIYGDFENKDEMFVPGSYVQVALLFDDTKTILVPQAALAQDENGFYAFVVDNQNVAVERRLRLGDVIGNKQIVKIGLNAGDKVVIKGVQKLKHGTPVQAETVNSDLRM
jgi:membrane fusion protein (multidrug efflux system)